jgi:hypothetical protein
LPDWAQRGLALDERALRGLQEVPESKAPPAGQAHEQLAQPVEARTARREEVPHAAMELMVAKIVLVQTTKADAAGVPVSLEL